MWLIVALATVLSVTGILLIAITVANKLRTFHAQIVGKEHFVLGETISFKAWFKGELKNGFFTCEVPLPNGRHAF